MDLSHETTTASLAPILMRVNDNSAATAAIYAASCNTVQVLYLWLNNRCDWNLVTVRLEYILQSSILNSTYYCFVVYLSALLTGIMMS